MFVQEPCQGGSICQARQCGGHVPQWATSQAISKESRRTRLQGGGRKGSWAGSRQEAQGVGPIVRPEQSWGRDHARPSHSYKLGQAVWRIGPPLPPPSAPSQGASCGGWTSPPGKGSDVKRQEGRAGWKRREGGDEGGGRHAENTGVTLPLRPGSQPTQSSAGGKDLLSLLLAQRHLVCLCQPLKPLLPQTLP